MSQFADLDNGFQEMGFEELRLGGHGVNEGGDEGGDEGDAEGDDDEKKVDG